MVIKCSNFLSTGTVDIANIPPYATYNIDLSKVNPNFSPPVSSCNGTASFIAVDAPDQLVPLAVIDYQRHISNGMTQSLEGTATGAEKIFVPAVYDSYYGWNSSVNILKLTPGNVTATITFSSGDETSCDLTDGRPGCVIYVPSFVPLGSYYAATIITGASSSENKYITAVVNAANSTFGQAQTYTAINNGISTKKVNLPSLYNNRYGWVSSFTCQNVGSVSTGIHIYYKGKQKVTDSSEIDKPADYVHPKILAPNQNVEVVLSNDSHLPINWMGGATIVATSTDEGARIACIVNHNHPEGTTYHNGDWSQSYNGMSQ